MRRIHLTDMERDGGEIVVIIIVLIVEFLADALKHSKMRKMEKLGRRFPFSQSFLKFRFGSNWKTFRRFVSLENSRKT